MFSLLCYKYKLIATSGAAGMWVLYVIEKEREVKFVVCYPIYKGRKSVRGKNVSGRIIGVISLVPLAYMRETLGDRVHYVIKVSVFKRTPDQVQSQ